MFTFVIPLPVDGRAELVYNNMSEIAGGTLRASALTLYYSTDGENVIMKFRRFCTLFLLLALLLTQLLPVTTYAVEDIQLDAKAALLVDAATGTVLLDQDAHTKQYPASITKVMTALLVFEAIERGELRLSDSITASANSVAGLPDDASTADIVAGEMLTVEQLLYCLLMVSANEVGNILAEAVSGSVTSFVALMNQRAQELGCEDTHFVNTSGLPDNEHYTTAWDIYLFTREAMKYDEFMTICNTKAYTVPATNKSEARELHSTNYLISNWRATGYLYSGAQGIKTGSTDAAGYCLVSSAVRADRRMISVVLGARLMTASDGSYKVGSFTETSRLFDWGFENFTTKTVLTENEMIQSVPVALSKEVDSIAVHPAYTAEAVLPSDLEPESLERTVILDAEIVDAPVAAGQQLGTITLSYDGVEYATVPLLAVADVNASRFLVVKHALKEFFARPVVKVLVVVLAVLIVLVFLFGKTIMRRRRYGSGRSKRRQSRSYRGRRF